MHFVAVQNRLLPATRGVKSLKISPENVLLSLTVGTKHSQCPVASGSCRFMLISVEINGVL